MKRISHAGFCMLLAALASGGFGCELIASVDRSQIGATGGAGGGAGGDGGAGGEMPTGGGGGMGGQGGAGGAGGAGGSGGSGGSGGGMPCAGPADCPATGSECVEATCDNGTCGTAPTPAGTQVAAQTPGDCSVRQCDGAGNAVDAADDTDLPVDGNDCTDDVCTAGTPSNPPLAIDTACGAGGTLFCDGMGQCVGCNTPSQCGADTECQTHTCNNGMCGVMNAPQGTPLAAQTAGDCQVAQCDGSGGTELAADNADLPVDGNECTGDVCTAGTPSNPPLAAGTACAQGGGALCDGSGACVACLAPSDCPGVDDDCQSRTCTNGACGVSYAPPGTPLQSQTDGDCKANVCDGGGSPTVVDDDSDLPDDNNPCTDDTCTAGTPVFTNTPAGLDCGAGQSCDGSGQCVGCNAPSDCPGVDDECKTRTCTANVCGFSFTAAGTAVSGQTPGDCQQDVCDGSGNVVTQSDNTDIPADDGNQCTGQACSNGAPVFPPLPVDTSCSQNGGSVCSAGGQCVQCNQATQCPGSDTECQARTCTSGTCGVSFQPSGTATSTQTPGDCQESQCDGAGNIVSAPSDGDVPVDGSQCTDDVCTSGVPSNPALPLGTACNQSGGTVCDGAGLCVAEPQVVSTTPADGAAPQAGTAVSVTFSTAMDPATLTGQTAAGPCSGSIQVSSDDFASCVAFSAASAVMSSGDTTATLTPAPGFLVNRGYRVRVTTAAASAAGLPLAAAFTTPTGFTTVSPNLCDGSVVISQVFGGGGSSAGVPDADYAELHNRGTSPVDLSGWSIQVASAAGSTWSAANLSGTIAAGGYFLVRLQSPQGTGTALPTPDVSGADIDIDPAAGKLALVSDQVALTGNCPTGAQIVDLVGYGGADCWEGAASAPAPSASAAASRAGSNACADVDDNGADFTTGAPSPKNSSDPAQVCGCTVQNESNTALEADYCNVQFPLSLSVQTGASAGMIYGQVYEAGVTDAGGASAAVRSQLGWGSPSENPEYQGYTWINAAYNVQAGNNDEYQASFTAPAPGSYRYVYRVSLDSGVSWTVCDQNAGDFGAGSNGGLSFEFADMPVLTVTP